MLEALAVLALLAAAENSVPRAKVKITQKHLVVVCLDGAAVNTRERKWRLEVRPHAVTFTMGKDSVRAGYATVRFTPEVGHEYEVEVRAPATTFSRRVWERGEWTPVVRDRTTNRIVSDEPEWSESTCPPAPTPAPPSI
jgi:hypothetical protein